MSRSNCHSARSRSATSALNSSASCRVGQRRRRLTGAGQQAQPRRRVAPDPAQLLPPADRAAQRRQLPVHGADIDPLRPVRHGGRQPLAHTLIIEQRQRHDRRPRPPPLHASRRLKPHQRPGPADQRNPVHPPRRRPQRSVSHKALDRFGVLNRHPRHTFMIKLPPGAFTATTIILSGGKICGGLLPQRQFRCLIASMSDDNTEAIDYRSKSSPAENAESAVNQVTAKAGQPVGPTPPPARRRTKLPHLLRRLLDFAARHGHVEDRADVRRARQRRHRRPARPGVRRLGLPAGPGHARRRRAGRPDRTQAAHAGHRRQPVRCPGRAGSGPVRGPAAIVAVPRADRAGIGWRRILQSRARRTARRNGAAGQPAGRECHAQRGQLNNDNRGSRIGWPIDRADQPGGGDRDRRGQLRRERGRAGRHADSACQPTRLSRRGGTSPRAGPSSARRPGSG